MDVSIIIVNYNTRELLKQVIESIKATVKRVEYEIIVVDNASKDGSVEMVRESFPKILLIDNSENLGFSKANNIGIKRSSGRYVLILNSDTVMVDNCIEDCVNYMDRDSSIGALGCKIVLRDGTLDKACKRGFPTPEASLFYMLKLDKLYPNSERFGKYNLTYLSEDEINEVDSLVGAFMMVKREAINKVGLLDEDFFMYGEDIDWCYRIKEAGYKNIYYPKAKIIHYKRESSKKRRFMTIYEFHRAMYLFYHKHYRKKYNILVTGIVYFGIAFKLGITMLINLFKRRG